MFDIKIIETGYIMADGGAMFGAIPKRSWLRKYPCNEDNLCPLAMRCVLAVSTTRVVLIDLGMGDKHTKQAAYYQPHLLSNMSDLLSNYGYTCNDITDVVLTHLHFDHCGYATRVDELGKIIPSFPKANYWLSRKQWNNVSALNPLEKDSVFADNIVPISDAGLLKLVDNDCQLGEGLRLRLVDGHTNGQLITVLDTHDGTTAIPGDLIPTSAHVSLEWISAYDINALKSYEEKKRFLEEAVEGNYSLIYYHDAFVQSSKVARLNDNFIASAIVKCNSQALSSSTIFAK